LFVVLLGAKHHLNKCVLEGATHGLVQAQFAQTCQPIETLSSSKSRQRQSVCCQRPCWARSPPHARSGAALVPMIQNASGHWPPSRFRQFVRNGTSRSDADIAALLSRTCTPFLAASQPDERHRFGAPSSTNQQPAPERHVRVIAPFALSTLCLLASCEEGGGVSLSFPHRQLRWRARLARRTVHSPARKTGRLLERPSGRPPARATSRLPGRCSARWRGAATL